MKNLSHNEEEKLWAALKGNENPFTVPSGYFEELPGKISDQLNALPDFEKASSVNPFSVPDNYFENLSEEISQKLKTNKQRPLSWLDSLLRPRIAIPTAFAAIIILAGLFYFKQQSGILPQQEEFTVEDLSNSYFLETIDEGLIAEILDNQKADTTKDNLEQYLIDNNIEISQIENAL
jgi:hypothetical protein